MFSPATANCSMKNGGRTMANDEPLMRVVRLRKAFGSVQALDEVSFSLFPGEVHGFIGPNGAGKTTAMRIMAGVECADSGDVFLDGVSLSGHPESARRLVGFMPDYLDSYPQILVWEYLDFYARIFGRPPRERRARLRDVVEFTGLGEMINRPVEALSKGWKQRLSLARVLLNDPSVLILDEPAAGLDPRSRIELRDMVTELANHGKAVFLSSHILGELGEMCTSVTIIERGRLRSSGGVDSLRETVDGGARTSVSILNPEPDEKRRLAVYLAQVAGVSGARESEGGAVFNYDGDASFRADLLARLVADGFRVTDFHRTTSSLEDAFMAVTGDAEKGAGK